MMPDAIVKALLDGSVSVEEALSENDEHAFNTPDHDYDPAWDYRVIARPHPRVMHHVGIVVPKLVETAREIGMGRPTVHYVRGLGRGAVAKYAHGTAPHPVLLIDPHHYRKLDDGHMHWAVHTSLFHEFGHAIEDWMGHGDKPDEEGVEDYARDTFDRGHLSATHDFMKRFK